MSTAVENAPLRRAVATGAAASPLSPGSEVPLTAQEFERICAILFEQSAIVLKEGKEGLVRSRLAKHVRRLGLRSYHQNTSTRWPPIRPGASDPT